MDAPIVRYLAPLLWICTFVLPAGGCFLGDPYTESRIVNDSSSTVVVKIVLDKAKYGVDTMEEAIAHAPEWFEEFSEGDGVEVLDIDTHRLEGVYRIAPAKSFIAHGSLGRKPYLKFNYLSISRGGKAVVFRTEEDIERQFSLTMERPYLYQFRVKDSTFE